MLIFQIPIMEYVPLFPRWSPKGFLDRLFVPTSVPFSTMIRDLWNYFLEGLDLHIHQGTLTNQTSKYVISHFGSFDPLTLAYCQTNKHTQNNSPWPTDWAIGSESGPAWTVVAANFGFQMSAFFLLQEKLRKSSLSDSLIIWRNRRKTPKVDMTLDRVLQLVMLTPARGLPVDL